MWRAGTLQRHCCWPGVWCCHPTLAVRSLRCSPSSLTRHCGALGSHAALCCAALVLLSEAAHVDRGGSAALVELAQLLTIGSLLRSLCERHGLQHRPPWCPSSHLEHFRSYCNTIPAL